MRKRVVQLFIILFVFLVPGLVECALGDKGITLIVPVAVEMFSPDATLRVRLWDQVQLEISQRNSACGVSYNVQTKTEVVSCPEGVEYQEANPEEFTFSVAEIESTLELKSGTIRVGEKYRLLISGRSKDNCNTTSADIRDVAKTDMIMVEKLSWQTTMMGCPEPAK